MDATTLIHRYLVGEITEHEVKELEELLADEPELRREFVLAAATDTGLREVAFEQEVESAEKHVRPRAPQRYLWPVLVTMVSAVLVMVWYGPSILGHEMVATIVSSENAAWESSLPTTPGSELSRGTLSLRSGIATIRFSSGAEVTLEAPAELEVISKMRGRLIDGAAIIHTPEEATGFAIETPDGYAIDYGTKFAVRVDSREQRSDFELIEGEIAVHHPGTGKEVRLTEPRDLVSVNKDSVDKINLEEQPDITTAENKVIRIGTNGRATSVLRNNKRKKFLDPEVLSVKTTNSGKWDYRSFFAFDLNAIDVSRIQTTRLRLNLVPSRRGFASRLPVINRFGVYGLTNPNKSDWKIESTWEQAPAPEDGILLGTFDVLRSDQRGTFGISNPKLTEFLQRHAGQSVTFILVRETTQIEGEGPGLMHMFASDGHPEAVGPLLEMTVE